jgi:hypothetical protein
MVGDDEVVEVVAELAAASPHGLELALFLRGRRAEIRDAGFLAAMHSTQGAGSCFHRSGCAEHALYTTQSDAVSSMT